jgi:hypothetical protein
MPTDSVLPNPRPLLFRRCKVGMFQSSANRAKLHLLRTRRVLGPRTPARNVARYRAARGKPVHARRERNAGLVMTQRHGDLRVVLPTLSLMRGL